MITEDFRIPINSTVKLRDGCDTLYPEACVGSVGQITKHKLDDYGYPMVYIKWDKGHWAYNGERDMWTYENHFDIIEEDMKDDKKQKLQELLEGLLEDDENSQLDQEPTELQESLSMHPVDDSASYSEALDKFTKSTDDGAGFFAITVSKSGNKDHPYKAQVFYSYKDSIVPFLIESQIAQVSALTHTELAGRVVKLFLDEE